MKERTVKLLGEEVKIKFCMAVVCMYERATNTNFDITKITDNYDSLTLYAAAIAALNPDTAITFDRLMTEATGEEINALRTAVVDSMNEWYHVASEVMPQEPQPSFEESQGEEKPKN